MRGVVSGAVGGALMGEVLRPAPPPPSAAAAAGASYRNSQQAANNDGWGRRNPSTQNNAVYPASFRAYSNRTYIQQNPTIFDHLIQTMTMQQRHQQFPNIDNMSYERLLEVFGDGNENRNLAASPQVISSLPSSRITNLQEIPEDKRQCVICMEEYEVGEERTTLPCCHGFHKSCVNRWLGSKGCCPVCKLEVG
jgi:phospholipase C